MTATTGLLAAVALAVGANKAPPLQMPTHSNFDPRLMVNSHQAAAVGPGQVEGVVGAGGPWGMPQYWGGPAAGVTGLNPFQTEMNKLATDSAVQLSSAKVLIERKELAQAEQMLLANLEALVAIEPHIRTPKSVIEQPALHGLPRRSIETQCGQ